MVSVSTVRSLHLSERVIADPPVVLAPMAGITNTAFRRLCREAMAGELAPGQAGGLFVSEMITTRALVERNPKTMRLIRFEPDETPRSIQLYGVDPAVVGAAVRMIVEEDRADHVDLNFGCPVPKVTRKGGGAALPWRIGLFEDIVRAAVREAARAIPVTVKMRMGIDDDHVTYLEAGLRAQDAGVAHVALHGRTAAEFYGGHADWAPIAELADARSTSRCSATATSGRPTTRCGWCARPAAPASWSAAAAWAGRGCSPTSPRRSPAARPRPSRTCGEVAATMRRHAELLAEWLGEERGVVDFRKHVAWYLKGFPVGGEIRSALARSSSLAELDDHLARLDLTQPFPAEVLGQPRGRTSGARHVALPEGWLASRDARAVPFEAELAHSGG